MRVFYMNNEITISSKRRQRIILPKKGWEFDATANAEFIKWKIKYNIEMEQIMRKRPNITGRKSDNIMEDFIMTRRYPKFDGRIITEEHILCNDKEILIKAEWDTGATYSCISDKLVESLGLQPIKTVYLDTSGGQVESKVYTIDLILGNDVQISVDANSVNGLESKGIQCLIGMDIITFGDFAISTYNGETCFSFRIPSKGLIDFKQC